MALIIPTAGVTSGKIGGLVHQKNGRVRQWASPTDPSTIRQVECRENAGYISNAWLVLAPNYRALWNQYAENTPVTNRLGQSIQITGRSWFTKANLPRLAIGLAAINTPPGTGQGLVVNGDRAYSTVIEDDGSVTVTITGTGLGADEYGVIYLSTPISPIATRFGPVKYFSKTPGNVTPVLSLTGTMSPVAMADSKIRCVVRVFNTANPTFEEVTMDVTVAAA